MIRCKMLVDEDTVFLRLKGHAGFAEEGKDIVCASASALCNTFVEFLRQKDIAFEYKLEKGNIEIKLTICEEMSGLWEVVSFVAVGLYILACTYPKNIEFRRNF